MARVRPSRWTRPWALMLLLVAATAALVCLGTAGALGEIADHGEKRAARGGARGFFCDDLR